MNDGGKDDVYRMLPGGGVYVNTDVGAIQFGAPPETIKDALSLGLDVPQIFVLSEVLFDRERGVNLAEVEFPAYYNFFLLGRRTKLVVETPGLEDRIRRVFRETLFGPGAASSEEFDRSYDPALRPDFAAQSEHFRTLPDGRRLEIDHLLEFAHFDDSGEVELGEGVKVLKRPGGRFMVRSAEQDLLSTPKKTMLPDLPPVAEVTAEPFVPPDFGITVLGSSHGFDPKGKTTGFILWLGRRGILVDPPAHTSSYLREHNVASKLIEGILITHCHADHDGGAFQRLLEEGRLDVFTTPTILGSFLRKYSALSGISEDVLRRTFRFKPVTIGAPTHFNGGELRFFYTLHSIPTIGFEAFYGGKSLAFSSDSLYDPPTVRELEAKGVVTPERAEALIDFPWHHSVVLHEAGIPPLHTPVANLAALPEDVRQNRLYVVHIAEKDVPEGLRPANVGIANTIAIDAIGPEHAEATAILDAFCSVELFRDFSITRAREVLQLSERVEHQAGDTVLAEGEPGDAFFIIEHGTVAIMQKGYELKTYRTGDYFGETSILLNQPRNADVVAKTDVSLIRIDRHAFRYLLRGTDIAERLIKLANLRKEYSWQLFDFNSVLSSMSASQKTALQTILDPRETEEGDTLWVLGAAADQAFLIDKGAVVLEAQGGVPEPFGHGAFIGDADAMYADGQHTTVARVTESGRVYAISRSDLLQFFKRNPGIMLSFLGTRFVE
ncbi:MAG: cAMP/cGMP-dependent 3',5'-cyclic-AMP/GMP phosphodiesterase [Deltaproteobacteria bacterium]|nr:cAMP/cGMP-dependent 3',5'-cyclic-AMP/GMP phosphodiesterase [Deltaproteobacteria bacterium]